MAKIILLLVAGMALSAHASDVDYSAETIKKTMRAICWLEFAKPLPDGSDRFENKFLKCHPYADLSNTVKQLRAQMSDDKSVTKWFGDMGLAAPQQKALPDHYHDNCKTQGQSGHMNDQPSTDYGSVLGDRSSYPYRAFAHCLVDQTVNTHGAGSLGDLKNYLKDDSSNWRKTLNDRENENRAKHGAKPLKMNKELSDRAQRWADNLAKNCNELQISDHIQKDHPDYLYKGKATGENIASNPASLESKDNAVGSANSWYDEIQDYPWPEYTGDGSDAVFGKIGHFTAQVWASVEQAGYGLARRDGCDKVYVVARYWPSGNTIGSYGANVHPVL